MLPKNPFAEKVMMSLRSKKEYIKGFYE